jgi:hypothetical protein
MMATIAVEGKAAHCLTALHITPLSFCGIVTELIRKYLTRGGVIGWRETSSHLEDV